MNVQVMMTINGSNYVDLVKVLSEKTHALNGKWLNSKISHIDDYFAGLIKVEIDTDNVEKLAEHFRSLGITATATVLSPEIHEPAKHVKLTIDANDRYGLVHDISKTLSDYGVKVEHMECHRLGLLSGVLFTSQFAIVIPDELDKAQLVGALQNIASDLKIDINE
ncbi:hypothetical protein [Psychromonas sp. MME2]|uniref:glycine cleavage system protein R n=1 Tax=unclassified Psychromonas TaxID=2614957 RepID=UPI00339CCB25